MFRRCKTGLVFVSAFPNRKTFTKYLETISWETEAWIADNPTHQYSLQRRALSWTVCRYLTAIGNRGMSPVTHTCNTGDLTPGLGSQRFVAVDGRGPRPIRAVSGDDPAGTVTIADPGLTVIGYHSRKYPLRFDSLAEFERYLRLEGLDHLLDAARKRHTAKGLIFEQYERCAKTLLAGPDISNAPPDRTLGLPLELLAETNPYRLDPDRKLRVRLLYHGKPLAGALVKAFNKTDPLQPLETRTDGDGRATFTLARPGAWLVSAVHMIPAPLLSDADWQSSRASVTFEFKKYN